ncbi:MAG: 7-cyano-7-deazaguanine synthase QueC [Terriglobales bacterium]
MDSCVCAALAAREGSPAFLHVAYGQRTEARERQAFEAMAAYYGVEQKLVVQAAALTQIGGSALTDSRLAVPESGIQEQTIPITYVPFRNAHFLAAAVSWAEVIGAKRILIGAVEQDSSGYPDCRPRYYEVFNQLIAVGTKAGGIVIETPLIRLSKAEIVRLGLEVQAPLQLSWSCYQGSERACGRCDSCRLRLQAFAQAGVPDPIPYAVPISVVP